MKNVICHFFEVMNKMLYKQKWVVTVCVHKSALIYFKTCFSHLLYDGHLSESIIYIIALNSCIVIDSGNVSHFVQLFCSLLGEISVWFQFFDSTSKAEINILYIYLCVLVLLIPKDWFPKVSVLS